MTKELKQSLDRLKAVTPKLNKAADEAMALFTSTERFLIECGVGIPAIQVMSDAQVAGHERENSDGAFCPIVNEYNAIAFDRHGGKFRLLFRVWQECDGELDSPAEDVPLAEASRLVKLESVRHLPALLQRIADQAEATLKAAEGSADAVKTMLAEMKP
jgi:hypothetical protein